MLLSSENYDQYAESLKKSPPCSTDSGKVKNKTCKFPFIFKGKEYKKCTKVGTKKGKNGDLQGPDWCATSVDRNRKYVKRSWGNCNEESCKAINGKHLTCLSIIKIVDKNKTFKGLDLVNFSGFCIRHLPRGARVGQT